MKRLLILLTFLNLTACDFKSSRAYNAEAERLAQEGKYFEAITLLNKAIEKDPNNIDALLNRGIDKSALENYQGAIQDYNKIIALDSDNTVAFVNRGMDKSALEDYQGAIIDFEKAIRTKGSEVLYTDKIENSFVDTGFEYDVSMKAIRFERGIARYNIDSLKLAFEDFSFCIDENFEESMSLYLRGIIYIRYGMKNNGCIDLYKAQKIGHPDALKTRDKYCY